MIEIMIGFVLGWFFSEFLNAALAAVYAMVKNENNTEKPSNPKHNPPRYYGYYGGWANVCKCKCGSVSLYEDNHPVRPCILCGTKDKREKVSARWMGGYWQFASDVNGQCEDAK